MQEGETIELQKKVTVCFRVMSSCFTDPAKAEENFQILDQLKDAQIWEIFARLLDPDTSSPQARSLRVRHSNEIKVILWCFDFFIRFFLVEFKV